MTTGATVWFVVFALSTGLFFGIALVVSIRGTGELRDLLRTALQKKTRP